MKCPDCWENRETGVRPVRLGHCIEMFSEPGDLLRHSINRAASYKAGWGNMSTISSVANPFPLPVSCPAAINHPDANVIDNLQKVLIDPATDLKSYRPSLEKVLTEFQSEIEQVHQFLSTIISHSLESRFPEMLQLLAESINLELLEKLAQHQAHKSNCQFKSLKELADFQSSFCAANRAATFKDHVKDEWRKISPAVINFIPQLINLFLGAFNFLDAHKKFTTLWDKYLLISIVCNFFLIPYVIAQALKPFIVSAVKVYAVSALIIVSVGAAIVCYQRWLKPQPDEVVNCDPLDKLVENDIQGKKVGQEIELSKLCAYLQNNEKVILIGQSGEGKTALVHHFVQEKLKGNLPKELQNLKVFELNRDLLQSSSSYGYAELIDQIKEQIKGFEDQTLIFVDNIHELAQNQAFTAFRTNFLEKDPRIRFIAATTREGYKKIKLADYDGSFKKRTDPFLMPVNLPVKDQDNQIRLILYEEIETLPKFITIEEGALDKIIELSKSESYCKGVGPPAKAIKILKAAARECQDSFNTNYTTEQLCSLNLVREVAKAHLNRQLFPVQSDIEAFEKAQKAYGEIKTVIDKENEMVQKIKSILEKRFNLKSRFDSLAHLVARDKFEKVNGKGKIQKEFLLHYYYSLPLMSVRLDEEMKKVSNRSIKVDPQLVKEAFKKLTTVDEYLNNES